MQNKQRNITYLRAFYLFSKMKYYQITSPSFQGYVEINYNEKGYLHKLDFTNADLSDIQHEWLLNNLPTNIERVNNIKALEGRLKLTEISGITFDTAWNKYDDKLTSSKKKSLIKWNKMPFAEQIKAYNYINKYFMQLNGNIRKKYFETYLNSELWNN